MKLKPFFYGMTAGVVGGAVASVFCAPQSGKQLRLDVASFSQTAKNRVADVNQEAKNVKEAIANLVEEAKNDIPQIVKELKTDVQQYQRDIMPDAQQLKQEIETLQKSVSVIEQNVSKLTKKEA